MKILVAGMGNALRGDDGFGIRVIESLATHELPAAVVLYDAGIGGVGLVQELMNGFDALILVDAIDKGAVPGTLFTVVPQAQEEKMDAVRLHESMVDMHYTDPAKVLLLARALNVCPPAVYLVGCQPEYVEDAVQGLRPSVQRAVPLAVAEILSLLQELSPTNSLSA